MRYVKPHGALYNSATGDARLAEAVADAVATYAPGRPLLGLAGSALQLAAEQRSVPFRPKRSPTAPTPRMGGSFPGPRSAPS